MNTPSFIEKEFCAVKFHNDGKLILGASSLNGRYWTGSLWCFPNVESTSNIKRSIASVETVCGISDLLCLSDGNIVVGKDSGSIEIYNIDNVPEPLRFNLAFSSLEHDDMVSSLSLNSDESRFSSSSYDQSIKIWDTQACASVATYKPIHAGLVWQSSFSTTDPNVLLSCGLDGMLLLLDLRLPKPATIIECDSVGNKPTAVCWKPQSNTIFAVGKDTGNIVVQDIRKIDNKVQFQAHDRPIFKLAFSHLKPSLLASCADENKVLVTDVDSCPNTMPSLLANCGDENKVIDVDSSPNIVYVSEQHDDFVRGLAWDCDNNLVTCGFDTKVLHHIIASENHNDPNVTQTLGHSF